jgi:hypothetical protein
MTTDRLTVIILIHAAVPLGILQQLAMAKVWYCVGYFIGFLQRYLLR